MDTLQKFVSLPQNDPSKKIRLLGIDLGSDLTPAKIFRHRSDAQFNPEICGVDNRTNSVLFPYKINNTVI